MGASDGALRVLKSVDWKGPSKICFSPDGRYIAYDLPSSDTGDSRNLFVMAVDGSREAAVENSGAVVGWSPDGKYVLFARGGGLWAVTFADGRPQGTPTLLRPDAGTASLGITSTGSLYTMKWILDYQVKVAAIDWNTGRFVTARISSPQEPPGAASFLPMWSPDGKSLAYTYNGSFIKIRSIETGASKELRPGLQYFIRPRWAPDGRSFLVAGRDLKGRPGIFTVDAQSGAASAVIMGSINVQDVNGASLPVWSPDGKFIYYRRFNRLMARDVASGSDREIISGVCGDITVSPDGRYIAAKSGLSADAKTCAVLLLVPVAGGDTQELLRLNRPEGILLSWSVEWMPDSASVLAIKDTGQRRELWQVPIAGTPPRKLDIDLTSWANGNSGFAVHPDGRQIAYTAGKNTYEIWALENFLSSLAKK